MARIGIQFIWILCIVNASQQILPVPKFIQNKVNEFKQELGSQWETYEAFKNNYTNLVILGITDPTKLLQTLNLTLTVPQKSGDEATQPESAEKAKAESLEKVECESDESTESGSAEDVSYELINQRIPANRQGLPLPGVPVTAGLSPVFTAAQAILLVPFIIANLVMAIVMFGINVSLRADSPRLTQIRQEQVEALAALPGVPAELVTPPGEDAGAAALARADSKEEDSSEQEQILTMGVRKCGSEGRSMGSEERLNPIERLIDAVETLILAPTAHQITTLVGLAVFWFLGTTGLEYLGLDTTLTLGIGVAAILWLLTPSKDPKAIDLSSFKSVNRRGKLCATEDDDEELRSLVEKSIRKKFM